MLSTTAGIRRLGSQWAGDPRAAHSRRPARAKLTLLQLARRAPVVWSRLRTAVLSVAGFSCLTAAAWTIALPLGLTAAGVSLLVLEALTNNEGTSR